MNYIVAKNIAEALNYLQQADGKALIISGGTDLMIDIEEKRKKAETLIDVMNIPQLQNITMEDDELVIGATVTLTQIAQSELVRQYFPSLAKGAASVGSLQIRNVATLTGNVISAQPAADAAMALAVLDPKFVVESLIGTRLVSISEMYAGFGESAIDSSKELVRAIRIPCPSKGAAASFIRLELRKSLALPMLNVACMAKVENGHIVWSRITMGPVGVGPTRATGAEQYLAGKEFNNENVEKTAKICLEDANPRSNPLRGSKEYRQQTLPVLIKRAFADIAKQLDISL